MNKYCCKDYLNNVTRIHPPRDQQKVDNRLRLHRAERLYPFTEKFFETFIQSINQQDIRYYPNVHPLKDRLAKKFNVKNNNILMNNGSSENIRIFYKAFAIKDKEVLITDYCYPMHKIYAELQGSKIKQVKYDKNMTIDYKNIINGIDKNVSCIVLANPNSPIGDIISVNNIENIINSANSLDIPILIDEAYIEYSEQDSCVKLLKKYKNLIISRTFSKGLGCAGLRIGYLIGNDEIMDVINKFIPTYELSSISAKFGSYLLDNYDEVDKYISLIKKEKNDIGQCCNQYQIPCILNHINTIHIKPNNIEKIKEYLQSQKILFRTRMLPYDDEEWLAIVLFPNFVDSDIFKKILEIH